MSDGRERWEAHSKSVTALRPMQPTIRSPLHWSKSQRTSPPIERPRVVLHLFRQTASSRRSHNRRTALAACRKQQEFLKPEYTNRARPALRKEPRSKCGSSQYLV